MTIDAAQNRYPTVQILDHQQSGVVMNTNTASRIFVLFTGVLISLTSVAADIGYPDVTFGDQGIAKVNVAGSYDVPKAIIEDADGRIVTAGYTLTKDGYDVFLTRTLPDGTPDTGFGNQGIVVLDVSGESDYATKVFSQSGGKLIVLGYANTQDGGDVILLRLNSDGSLDTSFSTDGIVLHDTYQSNIELNTGFIDTSGRIFVAGTAEGQNADVYLARFLGDGSLDPDFEGLGATTLSIDTGSAYIYDSGQQSDGSIILAGIVSADGQDFDGVVFRLSANGFIDNTFSGGNKFARFDISGRDDFFQTMVIEADNGIVVAGDTYITDTESDLLLARYDSNGLPDTSFNTTGYRTYDFGKDDDTYTLLDTGAGYFVAGRVDMGVGKETDILAAWFTADGDLNTSFGGGVGFVVSDLTNRYDIVHAALPVTSGYVLAVQSADTDFDSTIVKITAQGVLDSGFSDNGWTSYNYAGSFDVYTDVATLLSDSLVSVGYTYAAGYFDFLFARHLPNGDLDTAFGDSGVKVLDMEGSAGEGARDLVITGNNIYAGGYASINGQYDSIIASITSSGIINSAFGVNGITSFDFGAGFYDQVFSIAAQPNGSLIAAGYFYNSVSDNYDLLIFRLLANGLLDTSFADNGVFKSDVNGRDDYLLAVQTDDVGNIYAAGGTMDLISENGLIIKLTPNGTLDTLFANAGIYTVDNDGQYEEFRALTIKDNYLVAGGYSGSSPFLVKVLNSGASVASFGDNGVAIDFNAPSWFYIADMALDGSEKIGVIVKSGV